MYTYCTLISMHAALIHDKVQWTFWLVYMTDDWYNCGLITEDSTKSILNHPSHSKLQLAKSRGSLTISVGALEVTLLAGQSKRFRNVRLRLFLTLNQMSEQLTMQPIKQTILNLCLLVNPWHTRSPHLWLMFNHKSATDRWSRKNQMKVVLLMLCFNRAWKNIATLVERIKIPLYYEYKNG